METLWLTLCIAGLLTFLIRLSWIALLGRWRAPAWVDQALRFVPPAVLAAIIVPELLLLRRPAQRLPAALANPRLLAGLLAALVAWRSKNVLWTILAGMAALLILQWWI
jgi:branched-subunit amino acid transport protein